MEAAYREPEPCGLNKQAIYQLAEAVAEELDYRHDGDLFALVERLGGRIDHKDYWHLGTGDSGSTVVEREGEFTIYLATHTGSERNNFTIAHELGHYFLHYLYPLRNDPTLEPQRFQASRYGSERTEWEANWFAAAFLMPEGPFRQTVAELSGNMAAVAKRFGVSMSAAEIRAKALGIPVD